jgi:hypothetical protein
MNGFSQHQTNSMPNFSQPGNLSYTFQPSTRFEDSKRASGDARKYNAFGSKKTKTGPKKIAASIKLAVWFSGCPIEPVDSMEHKLFFEVDLALNLQLENIKKCINLVYVKKGNILDRYFMEYHCDKFFGFCTPTHLPIASADVSITDYFSNFLSSRKIPKDKRFVVVYLEVRLVLRKNDLNVISFVEESLNDLVSKDALNDSVPKDIVNISEDEDTIVNRKLKEVQHPDIQNIRSRDDVLGDYMTTA